MVVSEGFKKSEKDAMEEALGAAVKWLRENPEVEADVIQMKQKELEQKFNTVMRKLNQAPDWGAQYGDPFSLQLAEWLKGVDFTELIEEQD